MERRILNIHVDAARGSGSDESPGSPNDVALMPKASGADEDNLAAKRARRTEIEKKSRMRRQSQVKGMQAELQQLERTCAQLTSSVQQKRHEDSAREGESSRMSELKHSYLHLVKEAKALRKERARLREMLHYDQLFHDTIRSLATQFAGDDVSSWVASAHAQFDEVAPEKCFDLMRESYQVISNFQVGNGFVTSGASFMGWKDKRRLETSTMHFSFTKTFPCRDLLKLMTDAWNMFCDEEAMRKTIFTAAIDVKLQTLQVINDDIIIIHRTTHYRAMGKRFHTVYVLFRLQTDDGYTLCFRTIPAPGIQNSLEENESWIELFHWIHINRVMDEHGDQVGSEVVFGGSIAGGVLKFATHWMMELIMTVVRWENACISPMFILSENRVVDEDGVVIESIR